MNQLCALDIGYGFVKGRSEHTQVCFPAAVAPYTQLMSVELNGDINAEECLAVDINGEMHMVGHLALEQSKFQLASRDNNKARQKATPYQAAAALGVLFERGTIDVVSGLPTAFWLRQRAEMANLLQKRWQFRLMTGKQWQDCDLTVNRVLLLPQPYGSYLKLAFGDCRSLQGQYVGVIDIGRLTVNFLTIRQGRIIDHESTSTERGMHEVNAAVIAELVARGVGEHTVDTVDPVIRAGGLDHEGEWLDLRPCIERSLGVSLQDILATMQSTWRNWRSMQTILLTGGGAALLSKSMIAALTNNNTKRQEIVMVCDPQMANLEGYWKAGIRKFKGGGVT